MQYNKQNVIGWATRIIAIYVSIYHILFLTGALSAMHIFLNSHQHRAMSLCSILVLVFFTRPAFKDKSNSHLGWYDIFLIFAAIVPCAYIIMFYDHIAIALNQAGISNFQLILGLALVIALLEATRRVIGIGMPIIAMAFFLDMLFCNFMPGIFHGRGYSLSRIVFQLFVTYEGIFGIAMSIASTIIVSFIIFGQFLQATGAGGFFSDLASVFVGRYTGGPAKVAVIASALMGTVSGSTSANIATTGAITIPMMKKSGYSPEFSAAVETVASNGGQIMPPIMGAVAFIIAEWLAIPYIKLCLAAMIPAILYFGVELMQVDLEARRQRLKGLPPDKIPSLRKVLKDGWIYFIPMIVLMYYLVIVGSTPEKSVIYSLGSLFIVSLFKKESRLGPKRLATALEQGAKATPSAVTACGTAGIIISACMITGLGYKMSGAMVSLSGGNVMLLLLIAAVACYILGMGLGSIASYMIVALLVAPALLKLGVIGISAHLFVFYFALTSFLTPPVAIGAYIAAAIANSNPWRTAFVAMRIGIIAYIIPFVFVLNPAVLMEGSAVDALKAVISSFIACFGLGLGISGYISGPINLLHRFILITGALMILAQVMLHISWMFPVGVLFIASELYWHSIRKKREAINTIS